MRGFPRSNDLEETMGGAAGRGYPEWVESCDVDPDERGVPRAVKPRVEDLVLNNIKLYET
jgi:hypothetical protein